MRVPIRVLLMSLALSPATGCGTDIPAGGPWSPGEWVDLSYDYSAETVCWPTATAFQLKVDSKGMTGNGYWYEANTFTTAEHVGTHIDAPVHFAKGALSVDQTAEQHRAWMSRS